MATEDDYLMGYSLRRNGSCEIGEMYCGKTWGSFQRCCPGNTKCPNNTLGVCCPTRTNCNLELRDKARCADTTADLYFVKETKGHFCCTNNTLGFRRVSDNFVGCATAEDNLSPNMAMLAIIDQYTLPTSTSLSKPWP